MKRALGLFLLLASLCLGSCSPSRIYGDVNGEIATDATAYPEVMVEERAESIIKRANAGETVYLFHAYTGCGHCETARPFMVGALKDFNLQISLIYKREENDPSFDAVSYQNDVDLLESTYPGSEDNTQGFLNSYPRLYRIQGSVCQVLDFGGSLDSVHSLKNFLSGSARLNGLTHFRTYEKAVSFAETKTCPLYLYDETDPASFAFFFDEVRRSGSAETKPFAILDYNLMSESQKAAALAGLALTTYAPTLSFDSLTYDITKEAATVASVVSSYF